MQLHIGLNLTSTMSTLACRSLEPINAFLSPPDGLDILVNHAGIGGPTKAVDDVSNVNGERMERAIHAHAEAEGLDPRS